ncbi:MAG: ABC-F family ATP-binding cassette domain-containing protein [Anaerolineales bacterium]|nr:ABC-F family ATP-binding cassette domain-containing protein [Anaerolineales bacterium]
MMISISLSNLSLVLGAHTIFADLTWEIQDNQVIGLIGPNGAGKSSLLRVITGEHQPEPGGKVIFAKDTSIGYLPQHPEFDPRYTALQIVLDGNPRVAELGNELERIEARFSNPEVYNDPAALARTVDLQQRALDEYNALGGDSYPENARQVLLGLGLAREDMDKPVGQMSGGQKKLVGLARMLLVKPSVLLLDEPDNHLDLKAKDFLQDLITDYQGAVVIISHDRYLLDAVVTHIAEIEDGCLTTSPGSYTSYIIDKQERLARRDELHKIQQRAINRMEKAIQRYQQWTVKNSKFASRMHAMETRLSRVEKIERPQLERRRINLELNGWRGSHKVLELVDITKSFQGSGGTQPVLKGITLLFEHGERVGLIGPNGSGKSVLMRLILKQIDPDAGEVRIGPSVKTGYYSQEHETLNNDQTVLDAIRLGGNMSESNAVALLMRYQFTYQQTTQKIRQLSGGERSRIQLALLVLSGANFLLLDEPTNNLDIASAEVLETALEDFVGTVLVISHDRYFLDQVVDRILLLENGQLMEFGGGYSDYMQQVKRQ